MFTQQELDSIDKKYFAVIVADQYDVTLMSLNTRHVWQLHNVELPDGEVTVVFHIIRTLWLYELSTLKPLNYKDFRKGKFA